MQTCKNCGAAIEEGAQFCESCGAKAEPAAAPVEKVVEIKEVKKESNTFAIVAICLSGVCCLIYSKWLAIAGIVFGIVALSKGKEFNKPMRGLAITAIALGAFALVVNLIVTIIMSVFSFGLSLLW